MEDVKCKMGDGEGKMENIRCEFCPVKFWNKRMV